MDDKSKSIPFGYTLVNDQEGAPSGPPLLDNNESGYLQNFFDNPNNIDPSFLGGAQADRPAQEPFPVAGQHQQNWMMDGNGGLALGGQGNMDAKQRQQQQAYAAAAAAQQASFAGYGQPFAGQPQGASDDVYAAARLLHGNQGGQKPGDQDSFNYPQSMSGLQGLPHHGFTASNGASAQQAAARQRVDPKQTRPLNFGSDSKFRLNKYAAPKGQTWPDQDLVDAVLAAQPSGLQHNPWEESGEQSAGARSPGASSRKRRRMSNDGDQSGDDEDSGAEFSKRTKAEGDDEEDGKLRNKAARRKSARSGSPGRGKRSPTSGGKPSKENLSEEQKRANHIQSEQKRRNLIRQGFEDVNRMVPELRAGGLSKSNMLLEAAKFMRELKEGNERLGQMVELLDKG